MLIDVVFQMAIRAEDGEKNTKGYSAAAAQLIRKTRTVTRAACECLDRSSIQRIPALAQTQLEKDTECVRERRGKMCWQHVSKSDAVNEDDDRAGQ